MICMGIMEDVEGHEMDNMMNLKVVDMRVEEVTSCGYYGHEE